MFVKGKRDGWGICYRNNGDFLSEDQWKEGEKWTSPPLGIKKKKKKRHGDEVLVIEPRKKVHKPFSISMNF
jgi:hypothetical protein